MHPTTITDESVLRAAFPDAPDGAGVVVLRSNDDGSSTAWAGVLGRNAVKVEQIPRPPLLVRVRLVARHLAFRLTGH